jgi:hypothetical protein
MIGSGLKDLHTILFLILTTMPKVRHSCFTFLYYAITFISLHFVSFSVYTSYSYSFLFYLSLFFHFPSFPILPFPFYSIPFFSFTPFYVTPIQSFHLYFSNSTPTLCSTIILYLILFYFSFLTFLNFTP